MVTPTATITNAAATATVTFKDGGITIGTATLGASALSAGSHYITVMYDGDVNFTKGTSLAHIHRVKTPAGFPWWLIVAVIAAALAGLFYWFMFFRRRRKQEQPAQS